MSISVKMFFQSKLRITMMTPLYFVSMLVPACFAQSISSSLEESLIFSSVSPSFTYSDPTFGPNFSNSYATVGPTSFSMELLFSGSYGPVLSSSLPSSRPTDEDHSSYFSYGYTFEPTPSPKGTRPTPAPTPFDFAVVDTEMDIDANENPTSDDARALRTTIAAQTGVPLENIFNLTIKSSRIPGSRRRLASYVWSCSFQIQVFISITFCGSCGSSAVNFAAFVQTTCSSQSFNQDFKQSSSCESCNVIPKSVACFPKTPSPSPQPSPQPTLQPTLYPTPLPTVSPTEACVCTCLTSQPTNLPAPSCKEYKAIDIVENTEGTLECFRGTIKIKRSWYGIENEEQCTSKCFNTKPITKELCNAKETCTLAASNEAMQGDPAQGRLKRLRIWYCCFR